MMNTKTRIVILILVGLLITALISRNGDAAWMMLPFLAYFGTGILLTPARDKTKLQVTRGLEQNRVDGSPSVETTITIKNLSKDTVHLKMRDEQPGDMIVLDGETTRHATLRPSESTFLHYTFTAPRGDFAWESVHVEVGDPLGLITTEMTIPATGSIQIRPHYRKFKAIPLRPRSTLHAPGSIPARLGGSGTDFYGIREYHPGDPLHSLDWRMTARHPRKFFTKEFEREEIAEIGMILDARPNTELRIGDDSLFEHSVGAAASLAEMFLHQGHRVSLLVFGKRMSIAFPGYGKTQLNRIMNCLAKARVEGEERSSAHIDFLPIRMFPSKSMIIVFSPLASTDRSLYQRLKASGYQALLVSPNPIDFARPILGKDEYTRMAVRTALVERRLQLDSIAQLQVPVIDWKVNQSLYPLLRNAMTHSRLERVQGD
ncbi:DUF58 domain-containing protein [Leptolinea tardivitalis]|nr:DUF58 domain-containing protein [Leptolinea tardivitalis]